MGADRDDSYKAMKDRPIGKHNALADAPSNLPENEFMEALDNIDAINEWVKHVKELKKKLRGKKIDVTTFFQECGAFAGNELLRMAITSKDAKIRLEALKELLDRGGNSKVNKVAIASTHVDRGAAKEELIATIRGLATRVKDVQIIDVPKEGDDV